MVGVLWLVVAHPLAALAVALALLVLAVRRRRRGSCARCGGSSAPAGDRLTTVATAGLTPAAAAA